jgi:hypothetical protein
MKVRSTGPCEYHLINKQSVSYKLYSQFILQKATGQTLPLHDGQEEWGLALAGCGVVKVNVHGEFARLGNTDTVSTAIRDLLPLFSVWELPYLKLELIEVFCDLSPMEQRTQSRSVIGVSE